MQLYLGSWILIIFNDFCTLYSKVKHYFCSVIMVIDHVGWGSPFDCFTRIVMSRPFQITIRFIVLIDRARKITSEKNNACNIFVTYLDVFVLFFVFVSLLNLLSCIIISFNDFWFCCLVFASFPRLYITTIVGILPHQL